MDSHQTENRLNACENRWRRRIMRITYKNRITNETIRQRKQQVPVSNRIRQMQLKWLGHMLRMKDDRQTKSVHQWKPNGKRSRGRPNKRWMDCIEEDLRRAGVTKCGKRKWMTLNDHCCRQTTVKEPNGGINGWNQLDDDYLTWLQSCNVLCSHTIKPTSFSELVQPAVMLLPQLGT